MWFQLRTSVPEIFPLPIQTTLRALSPCSMPAPGGWPGGSESMKHLILWLGSKNGEPEEGMGRQEEIEVGDIYSPASALLGCVGWASPSIQGHSSSQVGLATQYSVSGFRSPLCPPLPSGLGQVRALSYYQPPGNCTIFVVPPHLCKWLLY